MLVVGLGAGISFAFLRSQIHDTFSNVRRLRAAIALPVLGSVTALMSSADRRRQALEASSFALVCLGLLGAYGGLVTVEMLTNSPTSI